MNYGKPCKHCKPVNVYVQTNVGPLVMREPVCQANVKHTLPSANPQFHASSCTLVLIIPGTNPDKCEEKWSRTWSKLDTERNWRQFSGRLVNRYFCVLDHLSSYLLKLAGVPIKTKGAPWLDMLNLHGYFTRWRCVNVLRTVMMQPLQQLWERRRPPFHNSGAHRTAEA